MSDNRSRPKIDVLEPENFDASKVDSSRYSGHYSDAGFMHKLSDTLRTIGREALFKALQLYYVLKKPDVPAWAKATIIGALGYFICPIDLVPDILPVVGFSDDIAVIGAALAAVSMYVDDEVNAQAQETLDRLLG